MDNNYLTKYINIFTHYTTQEFTEEQLDVAMVDLGINSFMVIEIMILIEEEFNVDFPVSLIKPDLFFSPKTLFEGLMTLVNASNDR